MAEPRLIEWLRTLDSAGRREFRAFLASPLHSHALLPLKLFDFLLKREAEWIQPDIPYTFDEPGAFKALYPGEKFKPQRIRRIRHELLQLLEEFIGAHSRPLLPVAYEKELRILQFLLDSGAMKIFKPRLDEFIFNLQQTAPLSEEALQALLYAEQFHNEFIIHNQLGEDTFEKEVWAAEQMYLARKFEAGAAMATREKRLAQRHKFSFESEILTMSQTADASPLVTIWRNIYLLEQANGESAFHQLEKLIQLHQSKMPLVLLRQARGYMFNFLARTLQPGDPESYRKLWLLINEMLHEGTLHLNGRISGPFFLTAIRSACLCGEVEWARQLLENHADNLAGDGTGDLVEYCRLLVQFWDGYELAAWRGTHLLSPDDERLDTLLRGLQLQLAFQLNYDEAFFRLAASFRKHLKRNSNLGARFLQSWKEFLRLAEALARARFGGVKIPGGVRKDLKKPDPEIAELIWLRKMLDASSGNQRLIN